LFLTSGAHYRKSVSFRIVVRDPMLHASTASISIVVPVLEFGPARRGRSFTTDFSADSVDGPFESRASALTVNEQR